MTQEPDPRRDLTPAVADEDLDPSIAAALWDAYSRQVDVETGARHLWRIHREAVPRRAPRRLLVAVLTGLMIVMSSGGALAASAGSVPGDVLYPVKRGAEQSRLLFTFTSEGEARVYLAMARARLEEIELAALRRPEVIPQLVADAMTSLEQAERSGGWAVASEAASVREEATHIQTVAEATPPPPTETTVTALPSDEPSTESTATATETVMDEPTPTAEPSLSPETESSPDDATTLKPTPSPTPAPSETESPTPEPSPSETPTAEPSPTPTTEPSPSETPTRGHGRSHKFQELTEDDNG